MRRLRIAVGQISSESDHFVPFHCTLDFFRNTGYLYEGNELLQLAGSDTEVAGILETLQKEHGIEIVPLLAARANSSGPLSKECYAYLKGHLLTSLREDAPVHGVILSHHGSMAAAGVDDPEGEIAAAVRKVVGPHVPFVMTLDLHGNVTQRMVASSSAIVGYEHYPHDDVYTTGVRGATLLVRAARGEIHPAMAQAKLPLMLTGFKGSTLVPGPFQDLMQQAKALEGKPGILSTSLFLVGSYLDLPEIGCSSVVVCEGDGDQAEKEARHLAQEFWSRRQEFLVETFSVAEAVGLARKIEGGPVLLLDTADTTGGGAAGDGAGLIKGLLECGVTEPSLVMLVDPEAAQVCLQAGAGKKVTLKLGHKVDPAWGSPVKVSGTVRLTSDGRFQYRGGILGGTWASMGASALLQVGSIQILIASYATYDWADEQYQSMGMNPREAKFVGVKNMMNFRVGYGDILKGFFVLDLPGPTPPNMRSLSFQRVTRPLFPFDEGITEPTIALNRNDRQLEE